MLKKNIKPSASKEKITIEGLTKLKKLVDHIARGICDSSSTCNKSQNIIRKINKKTRQ